MITNQNSPGAIPSDGNTAKGQFATSAIGSLCVQMELFERAAAFSGWPRERLIALGEAEEVYFRLYPYHYQALQTIRIASQLGKVLSDRQDSTARCESRLLSMLTSIMADALEEGDLRLREGQQIGELAFTVWALAFGMRALMNTRVATRQLGIQDGFQVSHDMTGLLLDAMGWRPLLSEWNYSRTRQRIRDEIFPDEWDLITRAHG